MRYFVSLGASDLAVDVTPLPTGALDVRIDGRPILADVVTLGDIISLRIDGQVIDLTIEGAPPDVGFIGRGHRGYAKVESDRMRAAAAARGRGPGDGEGLMKSPMPGRVVKLLVKAGDEVAQGTPLIVIEAMKMENELKAGKAGVVNEIFVKPGDTVEGGAKLIALG